MVERLLVVDRDSHLQMVESIVYGISCISYIYLRGRTCRGSAVREEENLAEMLGRCAGSKAGLCRH